MNELPTLLLGVGLLAVGAVGIVVLQRSVTRVERQNNADPEDGGLQIFDAGLRWFGIALIGAVTFMALMFGIALVLGSFGLGPFPFRAA